MLIPVFKNHTLELCPLSQASNRFGVVHLTLSLLGVGYPTMPQQVPCDFKACCGVQFGNSFISARSRKISITVELRIKPPGIIVLIIKLTNKGIKPLGKHKRKPLLQ